MHIKSVTGQAGDYNRRSTDLNFEPYEVCKTTFLSHANAVKCGWTASTVIGAAMVAAIVWAMNTNESVTTLKVNQVNINNIVISNQMKIIDKLDALKADNTRVGK